MNETISTNSNAPTTLVNGRVESCTLPWIVEKFAQLIATQNLLKVKEMPGEYANCQGFSIPVIESDWQPLLKLYPGLYIVLGYCLIMLLICIIWWIYWSVRPKSHANESWWGRNCRLGLLLLIVLLVVPLIFCLLLSFVSYMSCPADPQQDRAKTMQNLASMRQLYANYTKAVDRVFKRNMKKMEEYTTVLPNDLVALINRAVQGINKTNTEDFYQNSYMMHILLEEMLQDIDTMLTDFSEFIDRVRFFYRNTTSDMEISGIDAKLHNAMMMEEIAANGLKMRMLTHIKELISKFVEVIAYTDMTHRNHNAMVGSIEYLHRLHVDYGKKTWPDHELQFKNYSSAMRASLRSMSAQIPTTMRVYLPSYMQQAELAFCIIVFALLLLLCAFLWFAWYARGNVPATILAMRLLINLITLMCLSAIYLGILSMLHFGIGAVMYHFQNAFASANASTCRHNATLYCRKHAEVYALVQRHIDADRAEERQVTAEAILGYVLDDYRSSIAADSYSDDRVMELSYDTHRIGDFFTTGKIFATLQLDLDMHNMYEIEERVGEYVVAGVATESAPQQQRLLRCNLDTMKRVVFEQLLTRYIHERAGRLSRSARQLAMHLPHDLASLLQRVLLEVHELQHFYNISFAQLLHEITGYALHTYKTQMLSFRQALHELPPCEHIQLTRLGVTPHEYKCRLAAVHGFWIGGYGILIVFFALTLICICLVPLYQKLNNGRYLAEDDAHTRERTSPKQSVQKVVKPDAESEPEPEPEPAPPKKPLRTLTRNTPFSRTRRILHKKDANTGTNTTSATSMLKRLIQQRRTTLARPQEARATAALTYSKQTPKSPTKNRKASSDDD